MDKKSVYEVIDSKALDFAALSDEIWDYAELAFTEHRSAEALCRPAGEGGFCGDPRSGRHRNRLFGPLWQR